MALRTNLVIALAGLAPACASLDDLGTSVAASSTDCDDIICGNTPKLGAQPFFELDASRTQYSPFGGFRIKSFRTAGNVPLKVHVPGFGLEGISPANVTYAGAALEGSKLVIESLHGNEYELTIDDDGVGSLPFFEGGNVGPPVPTYIWRYRRIGAPTHLPLQFLCPGGNIELGQKDAIVFTGDRYSKATGKVIATGDDAAPWFNIACNDDALWKLAEFRFVEAARALPYFDTDRDDRNAAIKAIRADYCGDNHAWTEPGTAVDWANRRHWLWIDSYSKVEAIWDETGALCLSHPRYEDIDNIKCPPTDGRPPPCPEPAGNWVAAGGLLITYVP